MSGECRLPVDDEPPHSVMTGRTSTVVAMNDNDDNTSYQPAAWSTRTLVAAAMAAVVLGLGAGAALGAAGGSGDGGRGGPGGRPGMQRGQLPPGMQQPGTQQQPGAQQPAAPGSASSS